MPKKRFADPRQFGLFEEDAPPVTPATVRHPLKTPANTENPVFATHYWAMSDSGICYCDTSKLDIIMDHALDHSKAQKNPIRVMMGPGNSRVLIGTYHRGEWTSAD